MKLTWFHFPWRPYAFINCLVEFAVVMELSFEPKMMLFVVSLSSYICELVIPPPWALTVKLTFPPLPYHTNPLFVEPDLYSLWLGSTVFDYALNVIVVVWFFFVKTSQVLIEVETQIILIFFSVIHQSTWSQIISFHFSQHLWHP